MELGWDGQTRLLIVHPGAGKVMNRWPVTKFAKVCNQLVAQKNMQLFVTWGPAEKQLGRALISSLECPFFSDTFSSLRSLSAAFSLATLVLCNDTGVMHVAAAAGAPLVSVFGPTDPLQWKPLGDNFIAVRSADHLCSSVEANSVLNATEKILKKYLQI